MSIPEGTVRQERYEVLMNDKIGPDIYMMMINSEHLARKVAPGNFIGVRPVDSCIPKLMRPMSINWTDGMERVSIIYRVNHSDDRYNPTGTELLSKIPALGNVEATGPLGDRLFTINANADKVAMVSGGLGISPLFFLANRYYDIGKEIHFFAGFQSKDQVVCSGLKDMVTTFEVATNDGSVGYHGNVTDAVAEFMEGHTVGAVYACGPRDMYTSLKKMTKGTRTEVLMESRMACGVGVCNSCVVKVKSGNEEKYEKVCVDGPVFDLEKIYLE